MPGIFWLSVCAGYWLWAARGRRGSALQGFLHGLFLGLLCFGALPPAMGTPLFYGAAACAFCGAAAGVWLERKAGRRFFLFAAAIFTAVTLAWLRQGTGAAGFRLCGTFLGGMGLYAACCGILPEEKTRDRFRPAAGGGAGFLLAAIFFAGIGIF